MTGSDGNTKTDRNSTTGFLLFAGQAGEQSIEARHEDETTCFTQKLMAELVAVDVCTISEHLKNVYASGRLQQEVTLHKFRTVRSEDSRQVALI